MKIETQKEIQLIFNNNDVDVVANFERKRKFIVLEYFRRGKKFYQSQISMPNNKVGLEFIKNLDSKIALDIINFNYELI